MASRTIYISTCEFPYVQELTIKFTWTNGRKQQNIRALHDAVHQVNPNLHILEVSAASTCKEGAAVSPAQLMLEHDGHNLPVGAVYEASKVFENGGPYTDLLQMDFSKLRKDARLQKSGALTGYSYLGVTYLPEPLSHTFFDWLYGQALCQNISKSKELLAYNAFSDIEAVVDEKKPVNSPARAAAVFVGLSMADKRSCYANYSDFEAQMVSKPQSTQKDNTCVHDAPSAAEPATQAAPSTLSREDISEQDIPHFGQDAADDTAETYEADNQDENASGAQNAANGPAQLQIDGIAIPTVGQLMEISYALKVKNLLISLAKSAGITARTAADITKAGRELLITCYQRAIAQETLTLNPEKNKLTFPLENASTDFHTVGVLTRSPVYVQGWKLSYQSCDAPAAAPTAVAEELPLPVYATVEDYLSDCDFCLTQKTSPDALPPKAVQLLACKTGEAVKDPLVVSFLQFIRSHLQFHDAFVFRIPREAEAESKDLLVDLAQSWDRMGLFTEFNANTTRIICALASENDVVLHFASGKWLELYAVHCVQETLAQFQSQKNIAVSLCTNVVIAAAPDATASHELDIAFTVNGAFYWLEAKSSSRGIDYGKYAALCRELHVSTQHLLLVNSDLSEEECHGVAYFWQYHVANCATLKQELLTMIERQLAADAADNTG